MRRVRREIADSRKHTDYMSTGNEGGIPVEAARDNLIEKWVYFAEVDKFTFQFNGMAQVLECKAYFSKSVHPSTREIGHELEHYWHPWQAKLPKASIKVLSRYSIGLVTFEHRLSQVKG